jgi:hypothetical protein
MNIYKENDYDSQFDYFQELGDEFDLSLADVYNLAQAMDESEHFDFLPVVLQDIVDGL